jgi:hypothetical protein
MSYRRTTPRANARQRLIAVAVCSLVGAGMWAAPPAIAALSIVGVH